MEFSFINEIIILIIAAFIGGFAARTIKLPPVVGYLASGIIFGTVGRAIIPSHETLFELSQIGIALLLFTLGFEISLKTFRRMSKKILFAGLLQIILTTAALFPILLIFQFSIQISVLFALLFSFSSTAVVLKILEERGMVTNFPGNNVFVVLLIQDLFIVPVIFLMPFIFSDTFLFPQSIVAFLVTAVKPLIAFILLYILGRLFLSKIFHILFRYPQQELTILATIFTAVVSIGVLIYAGLPEAIAAFFAGVLVSEEGKNLAPLSSIKPLRDILLVLFFVLIGMMVNANTLFINLPIIFVASLFIIVVKFLVTFGILRYYKFIPSANIFISSYLSNVGEFALVIAQIALISNFIDLSDYEKLLGIFIVSLVSIPLVTRLAKYTFDRYKGVQFVKNMMGESHYFMRSAFEEVKDHVIILGHGRVGKEVRNLLDMGEVPYIVVDFNRAVIDSLASNMKNALYGDPADEDVLKSAGIKRARIVVIAVPDSITQKILVKTCLHLNPKVVILCRSHIDEDKYELVNLGVNTIVIPEFEAGLRIGKKVLELLGFDERSTIDLLRKLRKFHYVH